MALTLQNMRDHVRTALDVDTTDIPDSILDQWIRDGWRMVIRRVRRWPFMEKQTTLSVLAGTAAYTYATVNANCEEVIDVNGPTWRVRNISPEEAERIWPRNVTSSGVPTKWTRWQDTITFYPTPAANASMLVRYYEKPIEWVTGGAASTPSQLPDDFHDLIVTWALMRAHAQQEDLDLSGYQKQIFEEQMTTMKKAFQFRFVEQPSILGGGTPGVYDGPARLAYPFD